MSTNVIQQSMEKRSQEQIEKEYSCQLWTKRNFDSEVELLENFLTVCKEGIYNIIINNNIYLNLNI